MSFATSLRAGRGRTRSSAATHEGAARLAAPDRAALARSVGDGTRLDATRLCAWAAMVTLAGYGPTARDFC